MSSVFNRALLLVLITGVPAARAADNAFEELLNQQPTVVESVAADQAFVEEATAAGVALGRTSQTASFHWFAPFFPGTDQMSSIQWNEGYGSNPGQKSTAEASRVTTLSATVFQFQTFAPTTGGHPVVPEFVFADLASAKFFPGSADLKDKLTNKIVAVLKTNGGAVKPALFGLYTYSGFASAWDSKPELRANVTGGGNWANGTWAFQAAPFVDGYRDHRIVPGGSAGGNPDSEQWSAGAMLSILQGNGAYAGSGDWRFDETLADLRTNAETVTQSAVGWETITALAVPASAYTALGSAQVSFEYDGTRFDRGLTSATSAKRTAGLSLGWKLGAAGAKTTPKVTFGLNRTWQGVTNSDPSRKVSAFRDSEAYLAISLGNSDSFYERSVGSAPRYFLRRP